MSISSGKTFHFTRLRGSNSMNRLRSNMLIFALVIVCALRAFGQTAQVTGTVVDASNALVPGATITATNLDTGVSRGTTANEAGNFLVTALLPG